MIGSKLMGVDLSDCTFDELSVELQDLDGCMISSHQASTFVGLMGMIIR
jgi:hypothetical protein